MALSPSLIGWVRISFFLARGIAKIVRCCFNYEIDHIKDRLFNDLVLMLNKA